MTAHADDLVLAFYPNARGFAYVLFEGAHSPVDWGGSDIRGKRKARTCLVRLGRIIDRYHPDILLLRDALPKSRSVEFRNLIGNAEQLANSRGVIALRVSRGEVRAAFAELGKPTRYVIAEAIANRIRIFAVLLPPTRRIWNGEDRRMGLFDAAALALTFFYQHRGRPAGAA